MQHLFSRLALITASIPQEAGDLVPRVALTQAQLGYDALDRGLTGQLALPQTGQDLVEQELALGSGQAMVRAMVARVPLASDP